MPAISKPGTTAPEPWRGTTADERADHRRRQLLDAGLSLLAEGAAAVSVRAVTRVAGLSPRFFYESFEDREALLIAVWDEQYAEVSALVEHAIAGASEEFDSRMRAALSVVARWFEEQPSRAVVMLRETLADPVLRRHARRRLPELVLGAMAASVPAQAMQSIRDVDVQIAVAALSGAIVNLFLEWTAGHLPVGAEHIVESIVEVASAALARLLDS
ncbi:MULTISPECIES: TetR/AcrR family transcriptional regulator [Nocardioides]|uniref:TetR/AcrR family transcriptional regulator n=1 Tax=Nocardioides vastitatis TaxID=2568655 RepID=A0ABW0ZJC6_9ACTN|nr:TetR/AcrR family transcriptional regulator [Nocardioides sp.]